MTIASIDRNLAVRRVPCLAASLSKATLFFLMRRGPQATSPLEQWLARMARDELRRRMTPGRPREPGPLTMPCPGWSDRELSRAALLLAFWLLKTTDPAFAKFLAAVQLVVIREIHFRNMGGEQEGHHEVR